MTAKKKVPQDRKPKAEKPKRPEDVKGFHLLNPIDSVPVWDQAPLLALVHQLTKDANEDGELQIDESEAIELLGKIAKTMLPFAKNEKEYTKFATGRTALQDVMDLAMAWTSVLGEDESSDDN